MKRHLEQR